MANNKYLFKINNSGITNTSGVNKPTAAPELEPVSPGNTINVAQNFPWTQTGTSSRNDVPTIRFKEYNVTKSSLFQQARYLLGASPDVLNAIQSIAQTVGKTNFTTLGAVLGAANAGPGKRLIGAIEGIIGSRILANGETQTIAQKAVDLASKAGITTQPNTNLKNYLQPYDQLYVTKPTGFQYIFPYFTPTWKNTTESQWESLDSAKTYNAFDDSLKNIFGFFNEGGVAGTTGAGALRAFFPAAHIEAPKAFRYNNDNTNTISFEFYLYNTTTFDDVILNWQLCFLLSYQNKPNKASKILIDTPCIYEIDVPGILYCPFAYISNLAIEQIGGKRQMDISLLVQNVNEFNTKNVVNSDGTISTINTRPAGNKIQTTTDVTTITSLIPDAYKVTITVTPLVSETKNLMYQSVVENNSIYDVSTLPQNQNSSPNNNTIPAFTPEYIRERVMLSPGENQPGSNFQFLKSNITGTLK